MANVRLDSGQGEKKTRGTGMQKKLPKGGRSRKMKRGRKSKEGRMRSGMIHVERLKKQE